MRREHDDLGPLLPSTYSFLPVQLCIRRSGCTIQLPAALKSRGRCAMSEVDTGEQGKEPAAFPVHYIIIAVSALIVLCSCCVVIGSLIVTLSY